MKKEMECFEHVQGLIGIRTNIRGFRWGFGKCEKPVSDEIFRRCKIRVILEETRDRSVFDETDPITCTAFFRNFRAQRNAYSLLFEQNLGKWFHFRYKLRIDGNTVHLIVGKSYARLIKIKLMYIHPVAYILFDIVAMLLLKNGMTTLYCAAVQFQNGKTAVLIAPPNTGKSLTALKLRNEHGARILAEDMAVTDGKRIWGAPYTGLFRNYRDGALADFEVSDENCMSEKVDLIAVLEKDAGDFPQAPRTSPSIPKLMMLINNYSLGFYYSPCVRVLDYYNDGFSAADGLQTEESILKELQAGAASIVIAEKNSAAFAGAVLDAGLSGTAAGGKAN